MNKTLLLMLLIISSCKIENPDVSDFNSPIVNFKKNIKNDFVEASDENIQSCIKGCQHTFETLSTLKRVNKNSISLSMTQIFDFNNSCEKYCEQDLTVKKHNKEIPLKESNKSVKQKNSNGDDFLIPLENL